METEYLFEMRGVTKTFPGVKALDNVTISVKPGSVLALCGENGAGKSTLMKVLAGIYKQDAGEVIINGEPVVIANAKEEERQASATPVKTSFGVFQPRHFLGRELIRSTTESNAS